MEVGGRGRETGRGGTEAWWGERGTEQGLEKGARRSADWMWRRGGGGARVGIPLGVKGGWGC